MSGSIDVDVQYSPLSFPAAEISVFRYADGEFTLLPNVVCEQLERQIGATPSTARFRYVLDHSVEDSPFPTQFEQVWPVDAQGEFVVKNDDRVVVTTWTDQGDRMFLFDGYAQVPQLNLGPDSQQVSFTATGVECRAWDTPIIGRVQRDADDPEAGDDHFTDLPARFNPSDGHGGILPNCTPDDFDVEQADDDIRYPVFLDEKLERPVDPRSYWFLYKLVPYILSIHNADTDITNPLFTDLRSKLVERRPTSDTGTVDPGDPATYEEADILIRDLDLTNAAWPEAVHRLLNQHGFGLAFALVSDDDGLPQTELRIERYDIGPSTRDKTVRLAAFRSEIEGAFSNVAAISMARDVNSIVNAWAIETPLLRYEVSIVLAPGYEPASGDKPAANRVAFQKSRLAEATATVARKYRWYVADEAGDGHWDGADFVTGTALDLTAVMPNTSEGATSYVIRLRDPSSKLISLDEQNRPRKATLHFSDDYVGTIPSLWDGSGTWKEVPDSTWKLLNDRIGIEVTVPDPENWNMGKGKSDILGITWPATGLTMPLLLTTVIEGDTMLEAVTDKRVSSPTQFARQRRVDAKDHFIKTVLSANSLYNQTAEPVVVRDDTEKALNLAKQYRSAHEMGKLSGTITIPYLTDYYQLFDRITMVEGRDATLRGNIASEQGEGPRYPCIVKIAYNFSGEHQMTTLHLTDLRGDAPRA